MTFRGVERGKACFKKVFMLPKSREKKGHIVMASREDCRVYGV